MIADVTQLPSAAVLSVLLLALVLGLVMGSFLNCLAWRLVNGESVLRGRSHCATCGHVLDVRDLVPVVSWMLLGGRCRFCGERVSVRYPLSELVCGVAYVTIVLRFGLTLECVEMLAFASILLVLSLTDIDALLIPNGCVIAAVVVRFAYIALAGWLGVLPEGQSMADLMLFSAVSALCVGGALVVLAIVMDRVLGRESIGGGDVKLLAVAALYFGWQQAILLLIVACVLGIVFGLVFAGAGAGARGADEDADDDADEDENDAEGADGADGAKAAGLPAFPWGPSIAVACWLCMLFGQQVINWYLGLFL